MTPALARFLEEVSEETRVLASETAAPAGEGAHQEAADGAATCIRKQPLKAVGAAFGAGLVIGIASGILVVVLGNRWVALSD